MRIFCELAFKDIGSQGPSEEKASPAAISRKLDLDEKTVRLRIRKMEETGFIKYYQATPELALFGLKSLGLYRFEAMNIPTKVGAVRYVEGMPGVVEAIDYLGPTFSVSLAGGSLDRAEQLSDEIARRFELKKTHYGSREIGAPKSKPDRLDWQIIKRLRYDARSSYGEVAAALSVSRRMAEYRVRKVLESGAIVVRAVVNPQKQEGLVFYELAVTFDPERKAATVRAVREKHGEKLWSVRESAQGVLLFNLFAFTLAEPESAAMEILEMQGVRWCSILILKEVLEAAKPNWIDVFIEEKIASTGKVPARAARTAKRAR